MENIKETWYKVMVIADGNRSIVSQTESSNKIVLLTVGIFISKETLLVWGSYILHLQVSANPCLPNSAQAGEIELLLLEV